jgi:hypothetical protein
VGAEVVSPVADSEWGRRAVVKDFDGHVVELLTPPHRDKIDASATTNRAPDQMVGTPTIDPSVLGGSYQAILELGMENLRRFRLPERFDYLAIEIDHLHNLPHYMHETSVFVHAYYYCTVRPFYIERLVQIQDIETRTLIRSYEPHWQTLRAGLSPFAAEINVHPFASKTYSP